MPDEQSKPTSAPTPEVLATSEAPLLALRQLVLLPGETLQIEVGRQTSIRSLTSALRARPPVLVAAPQLDPEKESPAWKDLRHVVTLAELVAVRLAEDGKMEAQVRGLKRMDLVELVETSTHVSAVVRDCAQYSPSTPEEETLQTEIRARVLDLLPPSTEESPKAALLAAIGSDRLDRFIDRAAEIANLPLPARDALLASCDPIERAKLLLSTIAELAAQRKLKQALEEQARRQMESDRRDNQREFHLRSLLSEIYRELGEASSQTTSDDATLAAVIQASQMSAEARALAERTLGKVHRLGPESAERSVGLTLIDQLLRLPWQSPKAPTPDLTVVRSRLAQTHYGADTVVDWVVEELAVRRIGRGAQQVLCLVGPPGVGKTSLVRNIATAIERPLHYIPLGGVADHHVLAGFRRTYIGAEPGMLVRALQTTGSQAPVILLDEVDKMGKDYRGDPSAVLSQAIDPVLNNSFVDAYLEIPVDLSQVMFIATANLVEAIAPPLRSRMKMVEFWGYHTNEKIEIARNYLWPRATLQHGLSGMAISDDAIERVVRRYTAEPGVRELARQIERLCRAVATEFVLRGSRPDKIGIADIEILLGPSTEPEASEEKDVRVGRARTALMGIDGASVTAVDCVRMIGRGTLILTGAMSDIVKESAQQALAAIRARYGSIEKVDFHLDVPWRGPATKSGGLQLALMLAIASASVGRPIDQKLATIASADMHGSLSPVDSLYPRLAAVQRAGLKRVLLSTGNRADVSSLPRRLLVELEIDYVDSLDQALTMLGLA